MTGRLSVVGRGRQFAQVAARPVIGLIVGRSKSKSAIPTVYAPSPRPSCVYNWLSLLIWVPVVWYLQRLLMYPKTWTRLLEFHTVWHFLSVHVHVLDEVPTAQDNSWPVAPPLASIVPPTVRTLKAFSTTTETEPPAYQPLVVQC
jgi:hypothetical protein